MSATPAQNASNASNQTVLVVPTGIAASVDNISDVEQYADRIQAELDSLAGTAGSIAEVVVRGSYEVAQALDEQTGDELEVDSHSMDFRMFLDDESEEATDDTVRSVIEDGRPMAEIVGEVHDLSENEIENFDLDDRDDRPMIGYEVLSELEDADGGEARIGRAKAKSKAKASEHLLNDFYDYTPTADHTIIVEDGTDRYQNAAEDVRGNNNFVKYRSNFQ